MEPTGETSVCSLEHLTRPSGPLFGGDEEPKSRLIDKRDLRVGEGVSEPRHEDRGVGVTDFKSEELPEVLATLLGLDPLYDKASSRGDGSTFRCIEDEGNGSRTPLNIGEHVAVRWLELDPLGIVDDLRAIIEDGEDFVNCDWSRGGFFLRLEERGKLGGCTTGLKDGTRNALYNDASGFDLAIGVGGCDRVDGCVVSFLDDAVDLDGNDEADVSSCGVNG